MSEKRCKDCDPDRPGRPRDAPFPGPRCYSHHHIRKRALRLRAAERRVERVHGITPKQYDAQYQAQGGKCALCKRATGKAKRLAIEHDHALARGHDHPDNVACLACWRGLVCGPCNDVLAHYRDDPALLVGAANYLINPPARTLCT